MTITFFFIHFFLILTVSAISCTGTQIDTSFFIDECDDKIAEIRPEIESVKQNHDVLKTAKRYRFVKINPLFLNSKGPLPGDQIFISLFNETGYRLRIEKVNMDINNVLSVRGHISGKPTGYIILSVYRKMVEGRLHIPENNQEYAVSFIKELDQHILMEIDQEKKDVLPEELLHVPVPSLKKHDP